MARKQTVYFAHHPALQMTPNQFMAFKMKNMKSSVITRCGHFSLGALGVWFDPAGKEQGVCTELAAMREYDDLGQGWDEPMHGYGVEHWQLCPEGRLSHLKMVLENNERTLKWLDDLGGNHPMDAELRAGIKEERDALFPILEAGVISSIQ